eukprot:379377-Prymnesium_polylepis.3
MCVRVYVYARARVCAYSAQRARLRQHARKEQLPQPPLKTVSRQQQRVRAGDSQRRLRVDKADHRQHRAD